MDRELGYLIGMCIVLGVLRGLIDVMRTVWFCVMGSKEDRETNEQTGVL